MSEDAIEEASRKLRAIRDRKDALYKKHKQVEEEYKREQARLVKTFVDRQVDGIKVDGYSYVPIAQEFGNATIFGVIQDEQEFLKWAKEEAPELIEVRTKKSLLNELVRECLDDGRPLPPGVGWYPREYISQRAG